ncbi:hypothetical protein EJ08DRAFT_734202 [Tothia fuscella]|uniref:Uncharacterized protein n=1 Tax=Tothia fuscella TaxID=1048955 RepID=A0A9P4NS67_9PEZI|nr:hypothetical protein EJ08DRAFT_734202 [Tothia fuscella]
MAEKVTGNALPGFTAAETVVMAAAYYYARSADIDFEKVVAHVGSKSVASVKERLRLAKKKDIQIEGVLASTSSPAGGIDKKAAGKINASPRKAASKAKGKAGKGTPKKEHVKKEEDDDDDDDDNRSEQEDLRDTPMDEVEA